MQQPRRLEKAKAGGANLLTGYLILLGVPELQLQQRLLRPLERKSAGLLAYLTLVTSLFCEPLRESDICPPYWLAIPSRCRLG